MTILSHTSHAERPGGPSPTCRTRSGSHEPVRQYLRTGLHLVHRGTAEVMHRAHDGCECDTQIGTVVVAVGKEEPCSAGLHKRNRSVGCQAPGEQPVRGYQPFEKVRSPRQRPQPGVPIRLARDGLTKVERRKHTAGCRIVLEVVESVDFVWLDQRRLGSEDSGGLDTPYVMELLHRRGHDQDQKPHCDGDQLRPLAERHAQPAGPDHGKYGKRDTEAVKSVKGEGTDAP